MENVKTNEVDQKIDDVRVNYKKDLFFLLSATFIVGILIDRLLITLFGGADIHWFGIVLGLLLNAMIVINFVKKELNRK
jgi:hypothetical protein